MKQGFAETRHDWRKGLGACLALQASAVAATTDSARNELAFFAGEWTIAGYETTYVERCRWLPGGGFVACHAEDRSEQEPTYSMSVFGYSEPDGLFTYHGFGGNGSQRALRGALHGGVWRFYGESTRGPAWRRWQVTITPTVSGFHFREEFSERGGPWQDAVTIEYRRVQSP